VGISLTVFGIVIILFAVYEFQGSSLIEARAQQLLLQEFKETSSTFQDPSVVELFPAPGTPIGVIDIPTLAVTQVLVEGVTPEITKDGPGHLAGSPLPGQLGNVVIGGRRTTYGAPFRDIGLLRDGDVILITTTRGQFRYSVERIEVIAPGDRDVLTPTADPRLTLITSDPVYLATARLVVIAKLEGGVLPPTFTRPVVSPDRAVGLSGDATAIPLVLWWGQLLVLAIIATFWLYHRWRDTRLAAYLLTTPVLIALLLLLFQSLDRLLPATL
jgi:sortase A